MADSQKLALEFQQNGFIVGNKFNEPDVYIINSCTITANADRTARQAANYAKKQWPNSLVVMTGCYAERDPKGLKSLESVDLIVGGKKKNEIVSRIIDRLNNRKISQIEISEFGNDFLLGRTRASVKIQEGCDQVCSYCIVPKVRGREKSIPPIEIINSINNLANRGVKEVVLTGTQLGTYGFEFGNMSLDILIKKILSETEIPRIRVSSIQPHELNQSLLEIWMDDSRLCSHFHIPLQSGSDKILKSMRRKYDLRMFQNAVNEIRTYIPRASITTDIIAGYPGETDDDHEESKNYLKNLLLSDSHVFRYSDRPGTTSMYINEKTPTKIIDFRSFELREIAILNKKNYLESSIGQIRKVLWEENEGRSGLTDNYVRVKLSKNMVFKKKVKKNTIDSVLLLKVIDEEVLAEIIK